MNTKELQAELAAAEAKMNANDFDGAIAAYQAMLTKVPALTMLHMQIGRAQRMKKDYNRRARRPTTSCSPPTRTTSAPRSRSA